jgi:hypothetical protein
MTAPNMLDAALYWASQGWAVFPCFTPVITEGGVSCDCRRPDCKPKGYGKHPRTRNGFQDATRDEAQIRQWWTMFPQANIGGFPASAGLVAFDLDTPETLKAAQEIGLFSEPTMEVRTGNGTHRYYAHAEPVPSGATVHGIIMRAAHGYVLLPPSLHASGRRYELVDAETPPLPLPPAALAALHHQGTSAGTRDRVKLALASGGIPEGGRHDALLSLAGSLASSHIPDETVLQLVHDANTARCHPPKPREEVDRIVAFVLDKQRAERAAMVSRFLQSVEIREDAAEPVAHSVAPLLIRPTSGDPLEQPLPGVLETIAQWAQQTAPYSVRPYAVAAALAIGSVVCARRYMSNNSNLTSLYFLVVGKSGTGKEHVRKSIGRVLRAIDGDWMIGPNAFTSASALFTALVSAPQQVAIIDEVGQFLGAASGYGESSGRKDELLTTMMELYGRLDDFAQTPQYAGLTLSRAQKDELKRKTIERPALTFVGLTTPDMWYGALSSARIASGFLNRFCVIELANQPRSRRQQVAPVEVPESVVAWGRQMLAPRGDLDTLSRITEIPPPKILTITEQAGRTFGAFEDYCAAYADQLQAERLGEMPMRSAEQAMRLAMIAALAVDPLTDTIDQTAAEWGVGVASGLLERLVPAVRDRMADNELARLRKRFLEALKAAGGRGMTDREIKKLPMFTGVTSRDRGEVVQWAKDVGGAEIQHSQSPNGGRVRVSLVVPVSSGEEAA